MSSRSHQTAIAAFTLAFAFPALANTTTIGTYGKWDKSAYIAQFGCPDTTTYGQVITVPSGKHRLNSFTFWWKNLGASDSMVVRGYVYRWDGHNSTVQGGELFESQPLTISYTDALFHAQGFGPGIAVTPGAQYVLFASIDREYVDCKNSYQLEWGSVSDDSYSGGSFFYQNNGGDDLQWTNPWSTLSSDLAFQANLSP